MKVRYLGTENYVGADQFVSASLSCVPGDVVEVSDAKAQELLTMKEWEAAVPAVVPPGSPTEPAQESTTSTAGDPASDKKKK